MQLVHLPYLRQANQAEAQKLISLPAFSRLNAHDPQEVKTMLIHFFHLLQDVEKQLLPFFTKMSPDEFDWMKWLISPELASLLVRQYQLLPRPARAPSVSVQPKSLPQALGSAWALLHVNAQLAGHLPGHQPIGLDTCLLEQIETLAQLYCTNPDEFLDAQQAAKATLVAMFQEINSWELPVTLFDKHSRASA